jgi:hypothetical protein
MLGLLRMNVDQAIEEVVVTASALFRKGPQDIPDREENSIRLKQVVEGMIKARELSLDTKMYEPNRPQGKCRV